MWNLKVIIALLCVLVYGLKAVICDQYMVLIFISFSTLCKRKKSDNQFRKNQRKGKREVKGECWGVWKLQKLHRKSSSQYFTQPCCVIVSSLCLKSYRFFQKRIYCLRSNTSIIQFRSFFITSNFSLSLLCTSASSNGQHEYHHPSIHQSFIIASS